MGRSNAACRMKRRICVLILKIALAVGQTLQERDGDDCTNSEHQNLPTARIYDASKDVPDYRNSVRLVKPSGLDTPVEGWPGFECEHTKAIRWVLNLDYGSGLGESYSATTREAEDLYNSSSYLFKADLELQLYKKSLHFVVSCIAYENICERRSTEVVYNKTEKAYTLRYVAEDRGNEKLAKDLLSTVSQKQKYWRNEGYFFEKDNCAVGFSFAGDIDKMFYNFQPWKEFMHPRKIQNRQTMENAYLMKEYLSPDCLTDFCKNNHTSCYQLDNIPQRKYWPLVFYTTDHANISRIVFIYVTLISRDYSAQRKHDEVGKPKFVWEYSDKRDFIDIEKLPEKVAYNDIFMVKCKLSPFMFSFGTKIAYQFGTSELLFLNEVEEPVEYGGTLEAKGKILIESNNFTEKDVILTVYCFGPIVNSSNEWVNTSSTAVLTVPKIEVSTQGRNKIFEVPLGSRFSTFCRASGPPIPELLIEFPGNNSGINVSQSVMADAIYKTITISNIDTSHVGFFNCVATNIRGVAYTEFEIRIGKPAGGALNNLTITLISVFASVSAIFLVVVIILIMRFRMEKEEFRRLTEEAIREFQEGLDASLVPKSDDETGHVYANDSIKSMPYERKYEISHKLWTIDNTMLGSGAFGIVHKGTVEIGSRKSVVAVKTVKCPDDIENFKATLLELKIMAHVGHHRHIVKLVAASTEEIQNRKVLIAVELCSNGSLLEYLQKRKKLFNNIVQNGEIIFPKNEKEEPDNEEFYENLIVTSDISTIDLYKWSYQIASGMDFLESKKVLHADLACRNVLLTEELVVKISDFGLSRDLFENSEYTKQTQVNKPGFVKIALPWKWMAIESLKFLKFSTKSDVWSYGVTLYEVFTLGEEPYLGQVWTEEFVQMLDNGMRLNRPEFGTNNLYTQVMMPCWRAEPSERIRFADAMAFFEKAIELLGSRNDDECREFC